MRPTETRHSPELRQARQERQVPIVGRAVVLWCEFHQQMTGSDLQPQRSLLTRLGLFEPSPHGLTFEVMFK